MIHQRPLCCWIAIVVVALAASATHAQFGNVINIPPDPNLPDHSGIGSGTQLNLKASGTVGISFEAGAPDGTGTNVEVNIQGGSMGREYHANGGSVTNISAGNVGIDLDANANSIVNISGGNVGNGLDAMALSTVNVAGGTVGAAMESFGANVNISGGSLGNDFHILSDSLVNISGGRVGFFMHVGALDGSSANVVTNVSGGVVDGGVEVNKGATFTATGGLIAAGFSTFGINFNPFSTGIIQGSVIDYDFDTATDSDVRLYGGDFYIDDMPLAAGGQKITIPAGSVLTGTLANGTPIMLSDKLQDDTTPQTISLHPAALPSIGQLHYVVPTNVAPPSIRGPQTLTVNNGGTVGGFFRAGRGSTVAINGGQMGRVFEVFGATVNISGGQVFDEFSAHEESIVNISGGTVGAFFYAGRGTVVNFSGGSIGIGAVAQADSEVNVTGGSLSGFFSAASGSEVNISGGAINNNFAANTGSTVNLFGGDFRLDVVPVAGLGTVGNTVPINIPSGSQLSGTLADGTPIAFTFKMGDFVNNGTLSLHAASLPAIGPATINVPAAPAPLGIRQGQTLNLAVGGLIGASGHIFGAGLGSTVNVTGGEIQSGLRAVGATANLTGGTVRGVFAFGGSQINISGSSSVSSITALDGSTVGIQTGAISGIKAEDGSTVNITGGTFTGNFSQRAFEANVGSEVNVSGGEFIGRFGAFGAIASVSGGSIGTLEAGGTGTEVNLFGTDFLLGGVPIAGLILGDEYTITQRNTTLTGKWANGVPFSFDLNSNPVFGQDFVQTNVLLTITPVAPDIFAGDFNDDGRVDAVDYTIWRDKFGTTFSLPNETASFGAIDAADYNAWKANFGAVEGAGALARAAVPEPGLLAMLVGMVAAGLTAARSKR